MRIMIGITAKAISAIRQLVTSMITTIPTSTSTLLMMPSTVSVNICWITATSFWIRVITAPTPRRSM